MIKILKNIHRLCDGVVGQNYWFNGCMGYLMECLKEDPEYDYWFFSGVTGDSFTQVYNKSPYHSTLCLTDKLLAMSIGQAFDACGYTYDRIQNLYGGTLQPYSDRICRDLDRGIPVILKTKGSGSGNFDDYGVLCGYDDRQLYFLNAGETQPEIYTGSPLELIFVGEKKGKPSLSDVYRKTVMDIPRMLTRPETDRFSFGKQAFQDWAASLQNGAYDAIPDDDPIWHTHDGSFSCWYMHGNYLCILGTNGCAEGFLRRVLELNPDMTFIQELLPLYGKHNGEGFGTLIKMEGGFSLPPQVLKDKARMKSVSDKILEVGHILEDILEVFHNIDSVI